MRIYNIINKQALLIEKLLNYQWKGRQKNDYGREENQYKFWINAKSYIRKQRKIKHFWG